MIDASLVNQFIDFLGSKNRILLATHENPDGDGVGAMLGLAYYLHSVKKEVRIVVTPKLSANLVFLDSNNWIEPFDANETHKELAAWPEVLILLDANEPQRMGNMYSIFEKSNAQKACIDHHLEKIGSTKINAFAYKLTDPTASSSAELVFDIVSSRMLLPLSPHMAQAIYAGIVSDTGNFKFSNTTAKTHRLAATLIEQGVCPDQTYQNLYNQERLARLKLFGRAFDSIVAMSNNQYIRISVTKDNLINCGADYADLNGLVNYPLGLRGVEVSCLFYELPNGQTKASLRSRGKVDVHAICKRFGGGGHRLASGIKLDSNIMKAQTDVDTAILAQIAIDV